MQYNCEKEHGLTLELYRKVNRCSVEGKKQQKGSCGEKGIYSILVNEFCI